MSSNVQSLIKPPSDVNGVEINTFYYDRSSTIINQAQVTSTYGRTSVSLSNQQFGSSSQVVIPRSDIVSHLVLELEIPALSGTTDKKVALPDHWGYHCIHSVTYLLGGANQEIEVDGESIFIDAIIRAETREKADRIMSQGGNARVSDSSITSMDNARSYAQKAFVYLYNPWCNIRGSNIMCNKGLDTTLMSNSVHITIRFKRSDQFMVYDVENIGELPNSFSVAKLHWRGNKFTNQANSIADNLKSEGGMYSMPFKYVRDMPRKLLTGVTPVSGLLSSEQTIALFGIENSGLLCVAFFLRDSDNSQKTDENTLTNTYNLNPSRFAELRDVKLVFNGQTVVEYSGDSHKLLNSIEKMGSSGFTSNLILGTGLNPDKTVGGTAERFVCFLDLSQYNYAGCNDNILSNTNRYVNSSMQLKFKIVVDESPVSGPRNYDFYGIYVYNGMLGFDGSGTSQVSLL